MGFGFFPRRGFRQFLRLRSRMERRWLLGQLLRRADPSEQSIEDISVLGLLKPFLLFRFKGIFQPFVMGFNVLQHYAVAKEQIFSRGFVFPANNL